MSCYILKFTNIPNELFGDCISRILLKIISDELLYILFFFTFKFIVTVYKGCVNFLGNFFFHLLLFLFLVTLNCCNAVLKMCLKH